MVKSVVECSPDLTWALVAKNNVFIRRSRSATRQKCFRSFSAEAANVTSEHKFKFSGASTFRSSVIEGWRGTRVGSWIDPARVASRKTLTHRPGKKTSRVVTCGQ